ncbi:hypothetical protein ACSQ67_005954 [Phaseolus vulgaris]
MENRTSRFKTSIMQVLSVLRLSHSLPKSNDFVPIPPILDPYSTSENQIHFENEESFEEEEFSFAPFDDQIALPFSDEIFENGMIRTASTNFEQCIASPIVHDNNTFSLQPPLRRLFVVQQLDKSCTQSKDMLKGSCSDVSQNHVVVEIEASNKKCKKSKSTGFSKTWRLRESFRLRSNSDGKDTFVHFNPSRVMPLRSTKTNKDNAVTKKGKTSKCKTTFSPHEKVYIMNKRRNETTRRKTFLPYRQNLIGFFVNMNGFSRNINPF